MSAPPALLYNREVHVAFDGFLDLQVNGFAGIDFNGPGVDEDAIRRVSAAMRRTGVTRYLPTLITSALEHFQRCVMPLADSRDPAVAGLHMEGPYISGEDGPRGAHARAFVCLPSRDDFERRQEAARGRICLVTLAPELPGALALIEHLVKAGVRVAIGHSAASAAEVRDAIAAGASLSTHLGNACPRVLPRHVGNMLWEQLAHDELSATLIVDGHHLTPDTVKVMARAKTAAHTILVTDAIAAAAMPPGPYRLGDIEAVLHEDGRVTRPDTGGLAGSALTLDVAVSNLVRFAGFSLPEALACASVNPAHALGQRPVGRVQGTWDEAQGELRVVPDSDAD